MELEGAVALVTGGGSGIGRATAIALADAGARVVITGRREDPLRDTAAAANSNQPVRYRVADLAEAEQVSDLVVWAEEQVGPINLLVNNAGVNVRDRALQSMSVAEWEYVMQVNANGAYYVVHAVLPSMRSHGGGLIINISSMAGVRAGSISGAAYSASKHALNALTAVINEEEGKNGIYATAICPGAVDTPILDNRPVVPSPEQRARILQPEDVAAAVLFVATLPKRAHVPELHIVPAPQ
jgi:NAD(P)-dependent dehydrogenase (short-subunit alcohol dehydrogenase family)